MRVIDRRVFQRIEERLLRLYGASSVPRLVARLDLVLGRYAFDRAAAPGRAPGLWDERDVILICYGDMVRSEGDSALGSLRRFLREELGDAVSAVHVLPFFPYSSDDGFAVIDYRAVDPRLGDWKDIEALAADFGLMVDLVVNHVSSQSAWFRCYCNGMAPEREYFIEVDPSADLTSVVRPRATGLLRSAQTPYGQKHLWATFGADQVDVDFRNPDVLFEFLDILLFYIDKGARIIRLDAIAYLWKRLGTSCVNLPETHEVVKFLRDVVDALDLPVVLLTETNVPHDENVAYFGDGDESHMVYQFSLPPLLLHALHTGVPDHLNAWAKGIGDPPSGCTFLNFTASHDGVGLRPLEGLVPDTEVAALIAAMEARGGLVSWRTNADGNRAPYELNISYFSALSDPDDMETSVRRFLCSQTIALGLRGIPGVYFNSLLGAENDLAGVGETGRARSINRRRWSEDALTALLEPGSGHQANQVFPELLRRLTLRRQRRSLHPDAGQRVLNAGSGLFSIRRDAVDGSERLLMVANLTESPRRVGLSRLDRAWKTRGWREVISGLQHAGEAEQGRFELAPYQVAWWVAPTGSDAAGGEAVAS